MIAFFSSIGTLGFNGIITKKFADDESSAGCYLGSAILPRVLFSLISILFLQILIFVSNQSSITLHLIVFFQSLTILFSSFDLPVYWFRYKSKAQTVAGIRLIAFFISAFWRIFAVSVFKDIVLYVIAATLETLIFAFLLILIFVKQNKEKSYSVLFLDI